MRKLLEPDHSGGPELLVTRTPGYVLLIENDQLDLRRFEALVAEGRRLLEQGEAERAAEPVREGLGLWRGRPLADLENEPFAVLVSRELDDAWLGALETRVEIDLALGRHTELVPELDTLVRRHPLRERLRAQLMLALYRSGRQAEALDRYDEGRRMLGEEVGLEPGNRLRELQAGILAQDPKLDLQRARARPPAGGRLESGTLVGGRRPVVAIAAAVAAAFVFAGDRGDGGGEERGGSVVLVDPRTAKVERASASEPPREPCRPARGRSGPSTSTGRRSLAWTLAR